MAPWLTPLLFVYGLVFFSLGLALAVSYFQRRPQPAWSEAAERLKLLGHFGFWHGLSEWGLLLGPAETAYLAPTWANWLLALPVEILALSFAFLLQFSLSLSGASRRLAWLPTALFVVWGGLFVLEGPSQRALAEVLARYALGLPGSIIGFWQLRRLAGSDVGEKGIRRDLAGLAWAFLLYAFSAGLLGPPASFFPANRLNTETFLHFTGLPVQIFRTLAGAALLFLTLDFLRRQGQAAEREARRLQVENALWTERERIARDLHDGALQSLYAGELHLEALARTSVEEGVRSELKEIIRELEGLALELRLYVAGLTPADLAVRDLHQGVSRLLDRYRSVTMIPIEAKLEGEDSLHLDDAERFEIFQILRESLANALKHAGASRIWVGLRLLPEGLDLSVTDNGHGFDPVRVRERGLKNLRRRAEILGGRLEVTTGSEGTQVRLELRRPGGESGADRRAGRKTSALAEDYPRKGISR